MNILFGLTHTGILQGVVISTILYILTIVLIVASVISEDLNNRFISNLCNLLYVMCGLASGIYTIQFVIDIVSKFI